MYACGSCLVSAKPPMDNNKVVMYVRVCWADEKRREERANLKFPSRFLEKKSVDR